MPSSPHAIVIARDRQHLEQLIKEAFEKDGLNCDLNFIDVSNITDMSKLFGDPIFNRDLMDFNGDISKWDVSNVKDMHSMFFDSKFNGDISKWDVHNVEDMHTMFFGTPFNGDISNWDVPHVKDMSYMFANSQFNGDISKWEIERLLDLHGMFQDSQFEKTGKAKEWLNKIYPLMLDNATDFDGNVIALNRDHLLNLIDAAMWLHGPNCDLNFINTSNVTMMHELFKDSPFNGDISKWDVSKVKDMTQMFFGSHFTGNICNWNVSKVESMYEMFYDSALEKIGKIPKWYKE